MLVENKFIYVSLPRCASTAFMASCVKQNLNIKHFNDRLNINNQLISSTKYDNVKQIHFEDFDKDFAHNHESLIQLREKFGYYDAISVRRNKYERFISLWKHIIKMFHRYYDLDVVNKLVNLGVNEVLSYKTNDLQSVESVIEFVEIFIRKYKLDIDGNGINMLRALITPCSTWHNHDPNIIWFDFNELYKLEEWVSKKLDIDFKLLNLNSSNHFDSKLELNDEFKEKYDSIYLPYDEVKLVKTLF